VFDTRKSKENAVFVDCSYNESPRKRYDFELEDIQKLVLLQNKVRFGSIVRRSWGRIDFDSSDG
jgi:hypothetical protein